MTRKCILFVVDALSERIVRRLISDAELPAVAELCDGGKAITPCTSIFPSITPAATCSIVTGAYPRKHGIEGAFWFDRENEDIAYYGDDLKLVLEKGFHDYLVDFGVRLNYDRLHAPTLFERLAERGIPSGCVNFMWFRGPTRHHRVTPALLKLLAGQLPETALGPEVLKLGDFVHGWPEGMENPPGPSAGIVGRYGFSDTDTANSMLAMARQCLLPPFTLAYFPMLDDVSHAKGPEKAAHQILAQFDAFLSEFVTTLGGWEKFRNEYTVFIVGDHSQTEMPDGRERQEVQLEKLLDGFQFAQFGKGWQEGDELFVCPNMRATAIYQRTHDAEQRLQIVDRLLSEPRLDQVIWQAESVGDSDERIWVAKRDRRLQFWPAGAGEEKQLRDHFGNDWGYEGDLSVVDLHVNSSGEIVEDTYPNPLERIYNAFPHREGPIWVTADADSEMTVAETGVHGGGSHGSLCLEDSETCLIHSGFDGPIPKRVRITDVADFCLKACEA